MMSSMRRSAIFIPLFLVTTGSVTAQPAVQPAYQPNAPRPAYAPAASTEIDYALADWRRLRQSADYSFGDYARFVIANPGWPGETTLRKNAEKAMRPGEAALTVIGFYRTAEPQSGNGWARLAESLVATGKPIEALAAAKSAWVSGDLSAYDEVALFGRFTAGLTAQDHDRRVDALLFDKKTTDAYRMLPWTSPARRNAFNARIVMLARQPDAETRYRLVAGQTTSDAGLLMDRARYLRDSGNEAAARQLMARPHAFTERPANVERFYDMLVVLARGAMADRQYQTAYDIARQVDDSYAPGIDLTLKSYAVRDNYTTLTWTAGLAAYERIGRPRDAVALFDKYARGGRSLRSRPRGGTGPDARLRSWATRLADVRISSGPQRFPNFFTASSHWNGSAVRSLLRRARLRCWSPRRSARRSSRSAWSARCASSDRRVGATTKACSSALCPKT